MERSTLLKIFSSKASVISFKEILISTTKPKVSLLKRRVNYYVKKGELHSIRRGLYAKDKNTFHHASHRLGYAREELQEAENRWLELEEMRNVAEG